VVEVSIVNLRRVSHTRTDLCVPAVTEKPKTEETHLWLLCAGYCSTLGTIAVIGITHHSRHRLRLRWELRAFFRILISLLVLLLPVINPEFSALAILLTVAGLSLVVVLVEVYGIRTSRHQHWWTSDVALHRDIQARMKHSHSHGHSDSPMEDEDKELGGVDPRAFRKPADTDEKPLTDVEYAQCTQRLRQKIRESEIAIKRQEQYQARLEQELYCIQQEQGEVDMP
jgi:hypothetical protein